MDQQYTLNSLEETVFIGEIVLQSKIAQRANERLLATRENFDSIEVWCSIQSILVAAGNVSKILWPQKKIAVRGEALRKVLNIEDDHNYLLSDRKFRNHFEHYDERIDNWFAEDRSAVYTDLVMNPFPSIFGSSFNNYHRAYNSVTQTLTFRGEKIDLAAVLKELDEIRLKCSPFVLP
ncbi:MAG: hypothetical protein U0W24_08610 [Bacteroidales bacterium]